MNWTIDDLTTGLIAWLLVFSGAFFFGYPLGKIVGRRQMKREMEEKYFIYPYPECVAKAKKNMPGDILDAEILEVKNG